MAHHIKIDNRVYSIENFIEKCAIEHRNLDPIKGVIVKEEMMKTFHWKTSSFCHLLMITHPIISLGF